MAQYNGYRIIPHASYNQWRAQTFGNGYNVDYAYGNQCWDYCALLYYQYGLSLITKAGGGYAFECWTVSRNANARYPFVAVTGINNIKRGDIIVLNRTASNYAGHIAFADEDYNGSGYIWLVGQNQGGYNGNVNRTKFSVAPFLGIFRNTTWTHEPTPPTPTPTPSTTTKKDKFPWAIAWRHWPNFKQ